MICLDSSRVNGFNSISFKIPLPISGILKLLISSPSSSRLAATTSICPCPIRNRRLLISRMLMESIHWISSINKRIFLSRKYFVRYRNTDSVRISNRVIKNCTSEAFCRSRISVGDSTSSPFRLQYSSTFAMIPCQGIRYRSFSVSQQTQVNTR